MTTPDYDKLIATFAALERVAKAAHHFVDCKDYDCERCMAASDIHAALDALHEQQTLNEKAFLVPDAGIPEGVCALCNGHVRGRRYPRTRQPMTPRERIAAILETYRVGLRIEQGTTLTDALTAEFEAVREEAYEEIGKELYDRGEIVAELTENLDKVREETAREIAAAIRGPVLDIPVMVLQRQCDQLADWIERGDWKRGGK